TRRPRPVARARSWLFCAARAAADRTTRGPDQPRSERMREAGLRPPLPRWVGEGGQGRRPSRDRVGGRMEVPTNQFKRSCCHRVVGPLSGLLARPDLEGDRYADAAIDDIPLY